MALHSPALCLSLLSSFLPADPLQFPYVSMVGLTDGHGPDRRAAISISRLDTFNAQVYQDETVVVRRSLIHPAVAVSIRAWRVVVVYFIQRDFNNSSPPHYLCEDEQKTIAFLCS